MVSVHAKSLALGGVMAALALVVMCLGGLIPVATYVCPVLCMVLLCWVSQLCGRRIGWAWYASVTILSLLLGPDKEAAVVFAFLGYYPIIKPTLDKSCCPWVLKLAFFNGMLLLAYGVLIGVLGMEQILAEFQQLGYVITVITLLLGNVALFLLDVILQRIQRLVHRK